MTKHLRKHGSFSPLQMIGFVLAPVVCSIAALGMGSYTMTPDVIISLLWSGITAQSPAPEYSLAASILWQVRLPRVVAAALVGAGLAIAGAVFQGIFKNPLASPYTLGVSNGAGCGAGIAIILSGSAFVVQSFSVAFGLAAVSLTFLFASRSRNNTTTLILSGMLVGSLFASLVALLKFVADPTEKLPQIVYWIMGSLSGVSYQHILAILPLYLPAAALLFGMRWRMNVLALGNTEAHSMGINVSRDIRITIGAASVLTALVVSISGIVGWVGIVVPHLSRMMTGPDLRKLLPASASLGMCYLLIIDTICRYTTSAEIPLGVVTGIIGVPMFLWFIYRKKVEW